MSNLSKRYIEEAVALCKELAASATFGDDHASDLAKEAFAWYDDPGHCHAAPWPYLGVHVWVDTSEGGVQCAYCKRRDGKNE